MTDQPVEPTDGLPTSGSVRDTDAPQMVLALSRRTLQQLEVKRGVHFPQSVVAEARWDFISDQVKVLRLEISGYVLAEKLAEDHYTHARRFPFPKSPWQFFKDRHSGSWWLGWLVQRRPVVYEQHVLEVTVQVDRYMSYPQATIVSEDFGKPVIAEIARVTDESAER